MADLAAGQNEAERPPLTHYFVDQVFLGSVSYFIGDCDGDRWYMGEGNNITLCPDICATAEADLSASIEVLVGCLDDVVIE